MNKLTVRAMTTAEFDEFRTRTDQEFAAEQVRAGNWTAEEAPERSARYTDELLPNGVDTPGMLFLTAENVEGLSIGRIWVALQRQPGSGGGAWIYEFDIDPTHRGNGYGRELLLAAELETSKHGIGSIGLNVFGSNKIAQNLYESNGYQVTSTTMSKDLFNAAEAYETMRNGEGHVNND